MGLSCVPSHPLGMLFVEAVGWCSGVVWSWPPGVLVLQPLGRGYTAKVSCCLCLPEVTWQELQSDRQMVATRVGLGGAWERLSYEPPFLKPD